MINFDDKESIKVIVKPNAKKTEFVRFDDVKDVYIINLKAPAEDNKANVELLRFVKKISKRDVRILRGMKSREKVLKFL